MNDVCIYDTTLRDGAQQEGISLSVADKVNALGILDELGVDIVEGGWPGAIPKDTEFFARARDITLKHARLAAFGSTTKAGVPAADDPQVAALHESGAPIITLVAKSDPRHVERALRTTLDENLRMVRDTVQYLTANGHEVMLDLEHYFDGLTADPQYGIDVAIEAARAGATAVVMCDTNGGNLPDGIAAVTRRTIQALADAGFPDTQVGIHTHNDTGCAVANALASIQAGATQVQGCINGYGERTGNANLLTCIANLQIKEGIEVVTPEALATLTSVSKRFSELVNIPPFTRDPYVGKSAFAHKAGLHASAIRVDPDLYQHIDPAVVGSDMRMLVSEMAGRSSIELKAREMGIDLSQHPGMDKRVAAIVKEKEAEGYMYDAADASFELLLRRAMGMLPEYALVESWKTETGELRQADGSIRPSSEATIKIHTSKRRIRTAEGNGPVNALDRALRHALRPDYRMVNEFHLTDFRVRIVDESRAGTDAVIRVLVTIEDGERSWSTVGIGTDVIEASWEALVEGYWWGLAASGVESVYPGE